MPEVREGSEESNHAVLCDLRFLGEEVPEEFVYECEGEGAGIEMIKTFLYAQNTISVLAS